ncbi:MAG: hypothetical protein ACYDH0_05565 [Candidatus Aminicenantales bacterium]
MRSKRALCAVVIVLAAGVSLIADVALDEVVQAGRFVLYRDNADAHKYYYLPDAPRLATKRDGTPEFAFIKYSKTDGTTKGGIVSFLVTWGMTEGELSAAESALRLKDPEAKISGPVPFKEGKFKIVSAIAGAGGIFSRRIVGEGKAPIMPGQKAAVSIALTEEGASLLWESFKNPTSDISVDFALKFTGVSPAFQAKLKVNWDKVYTQHDVKLHAEGSIKVVKLEADVRAILEELRQNGAVQLEVVGENQNMQKMLDTVYAHLLTLMCDKVIMGPGEGVSSPAKKDIKPSGTKTGASSLTKPGAKPPAGQQPPAKPPAQAGKPAAPGAKPDAKANPDSKSEPVLKPIIGVQLGYTFKRIKMSGNYEVDMRKRLRVDQEIAMAGNIGGIYQEYGEDKRFFTVVSLDDPAFEERSVEVILDGQDASDFKNYINSVSVIFHKQRFSGDPMTGEVKFFEQQFDQGGNHLSFKYGRLNEASTEWLDYEYKPKWSFYGGVEWEGGWTKASDSVLTLTPPVRRRTLEISADEDNILKNNVKALALQIKHRIYGKDILKEVVINCDQGDPLHVEYTYMHEEGNLGYSYKIVWLFLDGREVQTDWMAKESPFIYAVYTKK